MFVGLMFCTQQFADNYDNKRLPALSFVVVVVVAGPFPNPAGGAHISTFDPLKPGGHMNVL